MTNIAPQKADLNQKVWEYLERKEVDDYSKRFGDIRVIDGPIFSANPATFGEKKIQIPTAFFKILIETKTGNLRTMQVIMPQDAPESDRGNLAKYAVSIRDIESQTKLDFFPDLPQADQDKIETVKSSPW
jgi:endonuclease G